MNISTPDKETLKARSNELHCRLDKIINTLMHEFDLNSSGCKAHFNKARILRQDLNNLEPVIEALDQ